MYRSPVRSTAAPFLSMVRQELGAVLREYPDAPRRIDAWRAEKPRPWPDWCFVPMGCIMDWLAAQAGGLAPRVVLDTARVAAWCTWRATQGVYTLHPALLEALWAQPLEGDLPVDLLQRLPEWAVAVPTPGMQWEGAPVHGFVAHLEFDRRAAMIQQSPVELRILIAIGQRARWWPLPIILGEGTLDDALRALAASAERLAPHLAASAAPLAWEHRTLAASVINVCLYLCADNRDIPAQDGHVPEYPLPTPTRRGPRWFGPDQPRVWEVGWRVGAALREGHSAPPPSDGGSGTHAPPRPHVRRGHWHHFWTGPRDDPARRRRILHWLSPMVVAAPDADAVIPTIRPVTPDPTEESAKGS